MNYAQLKAAILDESLRGDLLAQVDLFVMRAEGMIARDLRAMEMLRTVQLLDASRMESGGAVYRLPDDFLEDRTVITGGIPLHKTSLAGLQATSTQAAPIAFTVSANAQEPLMEFRGVPAAGTVVVVDYFARPLAFASDTDTNRLLTSHPSIYLDAALFSLYKFTQDLELAQAALDTWTDAKNKLNEQAGRFLSGTSGAPRYNIGRFRTGGAY